MTKKRKMHPNSLKNLVEPWKKGQSGNPDPTRPRGPSLKRTMTHLMDNPDLLPDIIRGKIEKYDPKNRNVMQAIAAVVLQEALDGNKDLIKLLRDFYDPQVSMTRTEDDGEGTGGSTAIKVTFVDSDESPALPIMQDALQEVEGEVVDVTPTEVTTDERD